MKTMISYIDLVIECRDYRIPLTSCNPLFEAELAGRDRLILYTKQDLGSQGRREGKEREISIAKMHPFASVMFSDHKDKSSIRKVMSFVRDFARGKDSLTGLRMMVVGMPNVGKSSLLNVLRQVGMHKGKAASTGAQPGVTRKIGTTVKIIEGEDGGQGVYLVDTPGVFMPYVPNAEAMLKLALCGSVKDTIIPPTTLADYLLFQINRYDPEVYREYTEPTNEIMTLLEAVARKTGRLQKGGIADVEAAALWIIQRWRNGDLGRFVLDGSVEEEMTLGCKNSDNLNVSLSQARKADKDIRRERSKRRLMKAG